MKFSEIRIVRDITLIIAAVLLAAACAPQNALAWPASPGIYGPTSGSSCPVPATAYDGCASAHWDAQFQDTNMIADYALDLNLNPITNYHDPAATFNPAGISYPVGMYGIYKTAGNRIDPRTQSFYGSGTITGGNTLTVTAITAGTPQVGMVIWDDPGGGSAYYPMQVKIAAPGCTGSLPTIVCPLDQTVSNHSFSVRGSFQPGCIDIYGAGANPDQMFCYMRNSAAGWTPIFTGFEFGAVNGHNATYISAQSATSGSYGGHVIVQNSHCAPDATTHACIEESSASNGNISLEVDDTECDGGNAGAPVVGPWPNNGGAQCIKWVSPGNSVTHNTINLSRLYVHDWTANPVNVTQGYVDVTVQSVLYIRTSMNCGNSVGNICHGAPAEFGTTNVGSAGTITMKNITVVYPTGATLSPQNNGVTSPLALLGGVGSAVAETIDIEGAVIICNKYVDTTNKANCGPVFDPFRVGSIPSMIVKHTFSNSAGVTGCGGIGGDMQASGTGKASEADNGTNPATSTWTSSGWSAASPLYYPGKAIVRGAASTNTIQFHGTLADNGDGTSHLHITSTERGTTTNLTNSGAITPQIVAFYMADWQAHPTLILSGGTADYTVSNNSGSGETQSNQPIKVAQVIMPFGQGGTTATGGTTYAGYAGTILLGGNNQTVAVADNNWSETALLPGNAATLGADETDNWMMDISGSAGAWGTQFDTSAGPTYCPATGSAKLILPSQPHHFVALNDNVKDTKSITLGQSS